MEGCLGPASFSEETEELVQGRGTRCRRTRSGCWNDDEISLRRATATRTRECPATALVQRAMRTDPSQRTCHTSTLTVNRSSTSRSFSSLHCEFRVVEPHQQHSNSTSSCSTRSCWDKKLPDLHLLSRTSHQRLSTHNIPTPCGFCEPASCCCLFSARPRPSSSYDRICDRPHASWPIYRTLME